MAQIPLISMLKDSLSETRLARLQSQPLFSASLEGCPPPPPRKVVQKGSERQTERKRARGFGSKFWVAFWGYGIVYFAGFDGSKFTRLPTGGNRFSTNPHLLSADKFLGTASGLVDTGQESGCCWPWLS